MNIAYMITAHMDPEQLGRLVKALTYEENVFYIHIDKKVDISPFLELLGDKENVFFIEDRVKDYWAGYSLLCTLDHLLEQALKKPHDRIVYISGLDYPVWSNRKMENYYRENPNKQILCGYNVTKSDNALVRTKINHYAYWDIPIKNEKIFNKVRTKLNGFLKKIPHPVKLEIEGASWDIYFGSDWWSLSYECARHVYLTLHKYPEIRKFFKYTFSPGELWVQTIVANSRYCDQMEFTEEYDYNIVTALEYIDYTSEMKVLKEEDFEAIIKSERMFIRKVRTEISQNLYKMIDDYRKV